MAMYKSLDISINHIVGWMKVIHFTLDLLGYAVNFLEVTNGKKVFWVWPVYTI